ncbi:hypothetical protein [Laspinema olomoucense]|uniref:Uncharacterized protein n=1 Tax=Laspinema olomoucense D3b TaxID=2953688 RepID=A0ABT2NA85_9CYAN|nr:MULTISPECIES: hypothetical protein [unclassified Laspinema]MCT7972138.1 hypothetical protein [Laspinema sp. D3d]MCT7978275.1 hypothetical protein [Laspinema sp. D3b]MCT7988365.1 hypothetical protein [Laspinema sp. D3a]MCT7993147.1 hypothetical protein [Laspinema sp. D3c]
MQPGVLGIGKSAIGTPSPLGEAIDKSVILQTPKRSLINPETDRCPWLVGRSESF